MCEYGVKIGHGAHTVHPTDGLQDNPVSGSAYSQGRNKGAHLCDMWL